MMVDEVKTSVRWNSVAKATLEHALVNAALKARRCGVFDWRVIIMAGDIEDWLARLHDAGLVTFVRSGERFEVTVGTNLVPFAPADDGDKRHDK